MTRIEALEEIKQKAKWSQKFPKTGGQHCGMPNLQVTLTCEEIDFEVSIGFYRSSIKNKQLAYTLFELAVEEFFK